MKLSELIPTNWLDPLLTGPSAALKGSPPWGCPDIERLLFALRARLIEAEDKQRIPDAPPIYVSREGWKLVPVELTKDMLQAMWQAYVDSDKEFPDHFQNEYRAALNAAPPSISHGGASE